MPINGEIFLIEKRLKHKSRKWNGTICFASRSMHHQIGTGKYHNWLWLIINQWQTMLDTRVVNWFFFCFQLKHLFESFFSFFFLLWLKWYKCSKPHTSSETIPSVARCGTVLNIVVSWNKIKIKCNMENENRRKSERSSMRAQNMKKVRKY